MKRIKKFFNCFKGETSESNILQPNDPLHNLVTASSSQLPIPPMPLPLPLPPHITRTQYENLSQLPGHTFLWQEIINGTENKKESNLLGLGDFGHVYRCQLPNIKQVGAAKILKSGSRQDHAEFVTEINTLHDSNHPNIIRILGKSYQSINRAIVYEFMPNGSLNYHLFPSAVVPDGLQLRSHGLDWGQRMKVALGVAEALVYLHTVKRMIHLDIKIDNVLLDKDFVPKLSDFGLAIPIRLVQGVETDSRMTPIMGTGRTAGYLAPETEYNGYVSTKSDVYSYGVLLLQLVTGIKAISSKRAFQDEKIADLVRDLLEDESNCHRLVDPVLEDGYSSDGAKRILMAAKMCVSQLSIQRPTMAVVETMVREAANYAI